MMVIKNKQLEVLEDFLSRQFYKDALAIRDDRAFIDAAMEKAEYYGIVERTDVLDFLRFLVLWGPDFDKDPTYEWTMNILLTENLSGAQKILRLRKASTQN
jgi:hypothetical protein